MKQKQQRCSQNWTAPKTVRKGSYSCTPLQEIRSLFLSGRHFLSRQLNAWTGSNDARKCISTLRKQGMNIKDKWLDVLYPNAPHIKVYWLEAEAGKSPQSIKKLEDEQLLTESNNVQQCVSKEPQRVDGIINHEWLPGFKQRAKKLSSGKEVSHEE